MSRPMGTCSSDQELGAGSRLRSSQGPPTSSTPSLQEGPTWVLRGSFSRDPDPQLSRSWGTFALFSPKQFTHPIPNTWREAAAGEGREGGLFFSSSQENPHGLEPRMPFPPPFSLRFLSSFSVSAQQVWGLYLLLPRESKMPESSFLLLGRNSLLFYCQSKEEEWCRGVAGWKRAVLSARRRSWCCPEPRVGQ